jgi:hypothetical protein
LSLTVVLLHLARKILRLLKITLSSGPWLAKVGQQLAKTVFGDIASLEAVTAESTPTDELRKLCNQLRVVERAAAFLSDRNLVSSWTWLLAVVFLGVVHIYMAVLFSFVYYAVARVSGVEYSWPEAVVTSLFIPFLIGDLPKIVAAKLLGGIQCTLVVTVGIGTVINYFRRRLDSIRTAAVTVNNLLAAQSIRERYLLLQEKVATIPASKPRLPPKSGGD